MVRWAATWQGYHTIIVLYLTISLSLSDPSPPWLSLCLLFQPRTDIAQIRMPLSPMARQLPRTPWMSQASQKPAE
jgi:hypothetical protein